MQFTGNKSAPGSGTASRNLLSNLLLSTVDLRAITGNCGIIENQILCNYQFTLPPHVVSDLGPVSEAATSKSRTLHTVATIFVWLQSPITILSSAALD